MHLWTPDEVQAAHDRITASVIRAGYGPELAVVAANAATAVLPTEPVADVTLYLRKLAGTNDAYIICQATDSLQAGVQHPSFEGMTFGQSAGRSAIMVLAFRHADENGAYYFGNRASWSVTLTARDDIAEEAAAGA
jgi:hypothetical protein